MYIKSVAKSSVAVVLFAVLAACGSGSDDPVTPPATNNEEMPPTEGGDTSTDVPTDMTPDNTGGDTTPPTALFGPPQFITSECGSMDISTKSANNDLATPTELLVGEVVRGQIVPGSTTENFDLWQISLEPGNYHLVADTSDLGDETSAIGIKIESIATSTSDNVTLASGSEAGFDLRIYEYLEIQAAQTMTLKVEASFNSIHNYTLGIIRNGEAVPSPSFERCLPINALSVDSTQSVALPGFATRAEQRWYLIDLPAGGYQLDASTNSAESRAIGYKFDIVDQFGQQERFESIAAESVAGTLLTSSDKFERDGNSPSWIRLSNAFSGSRGDITVEFTVSPQ